MISSGTQLFAARVKSGAQVCPLYLRLKQKYVPLLGCIISKKSQKYKKIFKMIYRKYNYSLHKYLESIPNFACNV